MHHTNSLRSVDLNLLVVLDALLTEQHVSRAASRLNMSQPAVSHALARLREVLNDPLLIRQRNSFVPTLKAQEIRQPLADVLAGVRTVLGPLGFDPTQTHHRFHLSMSDYGGAVVLPHLVRKLRREAPRIDVTVSQFSREGMVARVLDGELDLGLGVFPDLPAQVSSDLIMTDEYVCVLDQHSLGGRPFDENSYFARPHVLVSVRGDTATEIDQSFRRSGQSRHVAVVLPHWGTAPKLIVDTDLILTIARGSLRSLTLDERLSVLPTPIPLPSIPFLQIWHNHREKDPAHRWLRAQILDTARR